MKLYEEIYDTDYGNEITHQFSYFGKKQTLLSIAAASPGVGPSGPDPLTFGWIDSCDRCNSEDLSGRGGRRQISER